jgi:hypothetical protein
MCRDLPSAMRKARGQPLIWILRSTGKSASRFAFNYVIAVDPDIDMLAEGLQAEAKQIVLGIAWMQCSDADLEELPVRDIRVCTMGASSQDQRTGCLQSSSNRLKHQAA